MSHEDFLIENSEGINTFCKDVSAQNLNKFTKKKTAHCNMYRRNCVSD